MYSELYHYQQLRQCLWCYHHDQSHCESSPVSFDECKLSAGWPPTLRPSQLWAVSPPKQRQLPSAFAITIVIITPPVSWYSFYRPTNVGKLSRPRHCSEGAYSLCPRLYIAVAVAINRNTRAMMSPCDRRLLGYLPLRTVVPILRGLQGSSPRAPRLRHPDK